MTMLEGTGAGSAMLRAAPFILGAAACYTITMILMKMWGHWPLALMVGALALASVGALWFDILALREERLGMVYVSILLVEAVMIAVASVLLFNEGFSAREGLGMALMIGGAALAWS
jgi:small multidrug resistance pump